MHRAASRASCSLPEEAYAYTAAIGPKLHTFTEQRHDAPKSNHPPPNGGPVAWLQVLAGHLVVFNTWGYANSFGIFQAYYASSLSLPASTISWVGSVQVFLIFFIGSVSGRAFDTGYYRPVLWIGCAMQIVAVFVTSLCTKYWQVFLAQGVCQGLGNGLIFCPTIASVSTYFTTKRTIAISTAASGAATGGIVFPVIAEKLLPRIGFPWTVRVMGFVVLVNAAIVASTTRTRLPPHKTGRIVELAAFGELPYLLFTVSMFFTLWATYFAYYYVRPYALDNLHVSQATSYSILLIFNAVGIPGRIIPALLADRYFGAITVLIPVIFLAGLSVYIWHSVQSLASDIVWIVFLGFFGASIQGLFPSTLASLTQDLSKSGTRIGMVFTIISIPCLTGPPLAGRLIQVGDGNYIGAQLWGGTCLLLGCGILFAARVASMGWRWKPAEQ
ncbi:Short-chain dehydrogenase/reductase SDR [Penicillium canescens]|uniref:Short-chain dehydrogenase/reductase SDR n=1 Tax=Penicillium canescens TaxID=5083 RepID=A0AAD6IBE3_PENCN|nr:Short-chain dehydrogenase/reductase SDR [Penicillium canescens]KAJ6019743.1 Short-chain dehydrogenase/reductase SDR [Penicillium canescens]KAJ6039015.1 Short-chain dehydrogenase/reductase SDR [Penicillium canescens]KAJ6047209.1 Short-chain dehydrogenase/reductase SDR [Penicillium canescens]KAJ6060095.1 Short-chain dehydrogenase/reductase SDR [Penicillium canescens]KAJ6093843.1 Short-chain dehydrogenase/reductase SDR [Penicillium canescens]